MRADMDQETGCKSYTTLTVGEPMPIIMSFEFLDVFGASSGFFDIFQAGPQEFLRGAPADLCPK